MKLEIFAERIESIDTSWASINDRSQKLRVVAELSEEQAHALFCSVIGRVTDATAHAWIKDYCSDILSNILEEEYERGREDGQHEGN